MRKLLVASQKGGVGKTTSSINLAAGAALSGARVLLIDADPLSNASSALDLHEHPRRIQLRDAGLDLPGVFVPDVVPGLDVLCPYDGTGCSDRELDRLLSLLGTDSVRERYSCAVVDAPPFLGANPNQLLRACDEFVVVMRAEAMAHRTLPALLELAQRSKVAGKGIQLRGIALTLHEGDTPGGRWEMELRGRLGTRILSHVVPFDPIVTRAVISSRPAVDEAADAPASEAYLALVSSLGLATSLRDESSRSALDVLQAAFESLPPEQATTTPAPPVTPSALAPLLDATLAPKPLSARVSTVAYSESDFTMLEEPPLPPPGPIPAPSLPAQPGAFPITTGLAWVAVAIASGVALRFAPLAMLLPGVVGLLVAAVVVFLLNGMSVEQGREQSPEPSPQQPDTRSAAARRLSGLKRRVSPRRTH